jgi:hypothetical protein
MLCTFCGTENRPDNKFCGMCGVRMDRRQGERRGLQGPASLRCPSCGHVNEAGHKFCGMCGARTDRRTLTDRRPAAGGASRATAIANAQLPTPDAPSRAGTPPPPSRGPVAAVAAPASEDEAAIHPGNNNVTLFRDERPSPTVVPAPRVSGPSFLGLGDEPQGDSRYLLEDEASSGGVLRKLVLIAILAAIGGLVFVAWRSGTFRLPTKSPEKPPAGSPASAPSPPGAGQSAPPEASPSPANTSAVTDQTPTDTPSSHDSDAGNGKQLRTVTEKPVSAGPKKDSSESSEEESATTTAKTRSSAPPAAARKPSAALLKAQQYLQGRGVRQNCEQGLVYLRAATQQNDPAAAVQMGALYASGHCVTQDRVMAYRWFNSAHELDPGNQWIQTDLEQLWARMTPQERQKAGP